MPLPASQQPTMRASEVRSGTSLSSPAVAEERGLDARVRARSVSRLSDIVVSLAVVIAVLSVLLGGLLVWIAIAAERQSDEYRAIAGLVGVVVLVAGLIQGLLLALLVRYTGMKAAQILDS